VVFRWTRIKPSADNNVAPVLIDPLKTLIRAKVLTKAFSKQAITNAQKVTPEVHYTYVYFGFL
jgi:hypothetical protein